MRKNLVNEKYLMGREISHAFQLLARCTSTCVMEKFILIPWNDRMKKMRNDLSVCCHKQKDSVLFPFNTNAKQRNRE